MMTPDELIGTIISYIAAVLMVRPPRWWYTASTCFASTLFLVMPLVTVTMAAAAGSEEFGFSIESVELMANGLALLSELIMLYMVYIIVGWMNDYAVPWLLGVGGRILCRVRT